MKLIRKVGQVPHLRYALLFYLLLAGVDTLHHLHVALILGHANGMHSFLLGIILIPLALAAVIYFLYSENVYSVWLFLFISIPAIALPGFYHGGWHHVVKILAYLKVDSASTDIRLLFPSDNLHLWFYEISGSMEFVLALISSYFTYKLLASVVGDEPLFRSGSGEKSEIGR